jgi:hypothetical protein
MKTTTGSASQEILGTDASELAGLSKEEIRKMIDDVQEGIQGETLSETDRDEAAEAIYNESHR